jgi:hypothetical protein
MPGTGSVLLAGLLPARTIAAQGAPLPSFAIVASANSEGLRETDAPALPSSFYGSATLNGADLPEARTTL